MALSLESSDPSWPLSSSTCREKESLEGVFKNTYALGEDSSISLFESLDLVHDDLFEGYTEVMLNVLLEFLDSHLHGLDSVDDGHLRLHVLSRVFVQSG